MERIVIAERLDHLPPANPEARRSRRDLQLINRLMGNSRLLRYAVTRVLPETRGRAWRVLEAGAGDGTLAAGLWSRLPSPPAGSRLELLDRLPVVEEGSRHVLAAQGWLPEVLLMDVLDWIDQPEPVRLDLVYANLFLHHFEGIHLTSLLSALAQRAQAVVLLEPRRSVLARMGARLLGGIGCNEVTRHDAVRSVAAGFLGTEITRLWPDPGAWVLTESRAGLFGHCFSAHRRSNA